MDITIDTCLADVEIWRARYDQVAEGDTSSGEFGDCIEFGIRVFDDFLSVFVPKNDDEFEVYYRCLLNWYRLASTIRQTVQRPESSDQTIGDVKELVSRIDQVRQSVAAMNNKPID